MKKELRAINIEDRRIKIWRDRTWKIPKEWDGETVVIIGGGPSLRREDITYAIEHGWRRIAVNCAYLLDPSADVLVWGDQRWYFWNKLEIKNHTGRYKITWKYVPPVPGCKFYTLRHAQQPPALAEDPGMVAANNTGQGAINVAYHFGARRIVLLGFDMQMVKDKHGKLQHNWHKLHRRDTSQTRYLEVFAPAVRSAADILAKKGVEVVNCTPGSRLGGVPIVDIGSLS